MRCEIHTRALEIHIRVRHTRNAGRLLTLPVPALISAGAGELQFLLISCVVLFCPPRTPAWNVCFFRECLRTEVHQTKLFERTVQPQPASTRQLERSTRPPRPLQHAATVLHCVPSPLQALAELLLFSFQDSISGQFHLWWATAPISGAGFAHSCKGARCPCRFALPACPWAWAR